MLSRVHGVTCNMGSHIQQSDHINPSQTVTSLILSQSSHHSLYPWHTHQKTATQIDSIFWCWFSYHMCLEWKFLVLKINAWK